MDDLTSSLEDTEEAAESAEKSLAAFDTAQVLSNSSSDSDSSSDTVDDATDALSTIDEETGTVSTKLQSFLQSFFDSWNEYGTSLITQIKKTASQVVSLISAVWNSFATNLTNGTVYSFLESFLAMIGNIAEAWANAWNNEAIGTKLVQDILETYTKIYDIISKIAQSQGFQNLCHSILIYLDNMWLTIQNIAVAFENAWDYNGNGEKILTNFGILLENISTAIRNIAGSEMVQEFLNSVSDAFAYISEKLASIDWEPLLTTLTEIGTDIGDVALKVLEGLVAVFTWFVEHPTVATTLLAIVAAFKAFKGTASIISKINDASKTFSNTLTLFKSNTGGIVLIIEGLVAAVSSFVSMWQDGFSWVKEAIMLVGIALVAVGAIILGAPAVVAGVVAAIVAVIATVVIVVKEHWEEIKEFFSQLWENIKTGVETAWNAIKDFFSGIWESISQGVSDFINGVKEKFEAIGTFFTETIPQAFTDFINGILEKIEEFKTAIFEKVEAFKEWINEKIEAITEIKDQIVEKVNAIKERIGEIIEELKTALAEKIEAIKTAVTDKFNAIKESITTIIENVKTAVSDKFNEIKETITTIIENVKTKISEVWNNIKTTITTVIDTIKTNVTNVFNTIRDTIVNAFDTVKTKITTIWNNIWTSIKKVINSILGGIESMANGIVKGINLIINALNALSFDIPDWVPIFGGKKFGFNLKTLSEVTIPKLATGAYVKANTPQLAVIGDNKTQGEYVLPEDKLGSLLENNGGNNEKVIELLKIIIEIMKSFGFDFNLYLDGDELNKTLEKRETKRVFATNGG